MTSDLILLCLKALLNTTFAYIESNVLYIHIYIYMKIYSLAINFGKAVLSNATIKNGGIVITNGIITFGRYTDNIQYE